MGHVILFSVLLLLVFDVASSHFIVETLPRFDGQLPFTLKTCAAVFFIESDRDPQNDPLMFWLTGGPGCSGLSTILYEIGMSILSHVLISVQYVGYVARIDGK
uniref:Uncharacterized protein n=1 Tax=Solanum lycopersicum TaxID=4081 RepID=K4D081_SOLLC